MLLPIGGSIGRSHFKLLYRSSTVIPMVSLQLTDPISRTSCFWGLFPAASLLFCIVYLVFCGTVAPDYRSNQKLSRSEVDQMAANYTTTSSSTVWNSKHDTCEDECRTLGSEALPRGVVSETSNLDMQPLWDERKTKGQKSTIHSPSNLLAAAVGVKQKDIVNQMIKKFIANDFAVMLFHYDGIVDEWKDFEWSDRIIHVSAMNQTKWWFAKRFLHPDIVAAYDYIFLWDEDLGVENFHPKEYVSIITSEGLEISQPALDISKSEIHHQITARGRRSRVHRRTYKPGASSGKGCDENSSSPPCTGWIEMMAPVFSKAAWRCVWHMIQNDLIHAWGLDMLLGYCAQGDRTRNVGVVDAEYIVHYNCPTLGRSDEKGLSRTHQMDPRVGVRLQSLLEYEIFRKRWEKAAEEDRCWVDPYKQQLPNLTSFISQ